MTFDRGSAFFKSDEDHVEEWIVAIDKWIASAEARYQRLDGEAKQRQHIQQLNERFKNL